MDSKYKEYFRKPVKEQELVNNMSDYRGRVLIQLTNRKHARAVVAKLKKYAKRKKIEILKVSVASKSPARLQFMFRMGMDPGSEAQAIQGKLSSMSYEIEKFKFN